MATVIQEHENPKLTINTDRDDTITAKMFGESDRYCTVIVGETTMLLFRDQGVDLHQKLGKALNIETIESVAADQTAIGPPVDVN